MRKRQFCLYVFVIGLALLIFISGAFSLYGEASAEKSYQAEVTDISRAKYFPAVKKAMSEAKKSIFVVMFVVGLRPYDRESSVYQLMEELIRAHNRGVKVTVILDQNIGFAGREDIDEWRVEGKNAWCFKMLKEASITVWYDDATKYTHAKTIVIDGETVILGSANWTQSGLFKNFETNVLIKSRELAKGFLEDFEKIKIDKKVSNLVEGIEAPVPVSWKFLEKPKLGGRMMTKHDERVFDLYLLLLKDFDGNPKGEIILDYEKIAKSLGLYEKMNRTGYRRQIIRSLRKLETKYSLIGFEPQHGKEAMVVLVNYEEPGKVYHYPEEWYF